MNIEKAMMDDGFSATTITNAKRKEQEEMSQQIAEYLARGGEIEIIDDTIERSLEEVSHLSQQIGLKHAVGSARAFGAYK